MDTISSRESNTNFLPMAAVAVGAIAIVLSIIALVKMTSVSKDINDAKQGISARVDGIESQVTQLTQLGNGNDASIKSVAAGTQTGFTQISNELTQVKARLDKLEAVRVAVSTPAHGGPRGPVVAGPGEYIVKAGDTSGVKIAAANNVKLADLMAVNPDVDWKHLRIGQKLKLPAKAAAQPAQ